MNPMSRTLPASCLLLVTLPILPLSLTGQSDRPTKVQTPIQVQSSLVLVDVITQDPKNGLPLRTLNKDDFRLFNDRKEIAAATFATGGGYQARPIIVWLTVLCNEGGKIAGSREFSGRETLFRPALDQLDKHDMVAIAHWCDNGEARLDLLPTQNYDAAILTLTDTLKPIPFNIGGNSNFLGEAAFLKLIHLIIQDAQRRNPQPLPVIVFLYGGRGAQPRRALDELVDDILETFGIVFGIKDERVSMEPSPSGPGEQGHFTEYIAENTGGQYLTAPSRHYAAALEMILMQLHFRYELGFIPPALDGQRHEIKVELNKEAREKYKGVRLRYRTEYIPIPELPTWAR